MRNLGILTPHFGPEGGNWLRIGFIFTPQRSGYSRTILSFYVVYVNLAPCQIGFVFSFLPQRPQRSQSWLGFQIYDSGLPTSRQQIGFVFSFSYQPQRSQRTRRRAVSLWISGRQPTIGFVSSVLPFPFVFLLAPDPSALLRACFWILYTILQCLYIY